jgi:transcriptional regulator with XRE-family HTH domain
MPPRAKRRRRVASPPDRTPFASALVDARGDRPQAAIADEVGVEQVTVSSWERGELMPRAHRLDAIAAAYGLPPTRLRTLYFDSAKRAA